MTERSTGVYLLDKWLNVVFSTRKLFADKSEVKLHDKRQTLLTFKLDQTTDSVLLLTEGWVGNSLL